MCHSPSPCAWSPSSSKSGIWNLELNRHRILTPVIPPGHFLLALCWWSGCVWVMQAPTKGEFTFYHWHHQHHQHQWHLSHHYCNLVTSTQRLRPSIVIMSWVDRPCSLALAWLLLGFRRLNFTRFPSAISQFLLDNYLLWANNQILLHSMEPSHNSTFNDYRDHQKYIVCGLILL